MDGELGRFMRWINATHTMRNRDRYRASGQGHLYQGRFKSIPIQDDAHFLTECRDVERNAAGARLQKQAEDLRWGSLWRWTQAIEHDLMLLLPWLTHRSPHQIARVNQQLFEVELAAVRQPAQKGSPQGSQEWIEQTAIRLGPDFTLRNRCRPKSIFRNTHK